ncbi:unnamed protein product [Durusdinium trenchii]|uniref:Uncharacterized protein n=1 Tax=Durusdinium trenchii TaxID=1381693 RepID=A0ABP0NBD2_9DINO
MSMTDRLKEYHRTLRQKRGEELSMKQVAGSFGGLYAVIHMLQYFDIWTLLLLMVGVYFIYRQIADNWSKIMAAFTQETPEPVSATSTSSSHWDAHSAATDRTTHQATNK